MSSKSFIKKCAFGKLKNVSAAYNIDRGNEPHTKIIDMPSPFNGKLTVDDMLEPSEFLLLEFKGIHDSYYIGINDVSFYDENDEPIDYTNVAVDGRTVDHEEVHPVMPVNGWWAIAGDEHSLLFQFTNPKQRVKQIGLVCANASATPKYVHVTDGRVPTNSNDSNFHRDCFFQLAGEEGKNPAQLKFMLTPNKKDAYLLIDVIANCNKNAPANGFCSLFSSCEKYIYVFYRQGLRTRAYNYYFGKNPTRAYDLATSIKSSSSSNGLTANNKVEERAMTLEELQAVRAIILSSCVKDKWKSRHGSLLRPDDVNLYDLNAVLIKPLTKKRNCSFKELFSSKPSTPTFYTSHWWGENILDFIRCCEYHATMHGLEASEAKYWVCAYANRQHDLGKDLGTNPDKSSFRRAMDVAEGVVLIIDPDSVVYSRIWVDFELFKTMGSKHSSIDMVTHHAGDVHLLASKSFGEGPYQRNCRELHFPFDTICKKGLTLELENGEASQLIDKVRILNVMTENEDLDSKKTLQVLNDPDRMRNPDFQDDDKYYQKGNNALRSELALKCISAALMTEGQSLENFHGHNLLDIVASDEVRTNLTIEVLSIDEVTDPVLHQLVSMVTSTVKELDLNVVGCQNLTDESLHSIVLPDSLTGLHMSLGMCKQFTNEGVITTVTKLPKKLTSLTLDVRSHKKSDGSYSPSRRNDHLEAIATHLPPSLVEVDLSITLDSSEDGSGVEQLAKALPRGLKEFSLNIEKWGGFKGEYMISIAASLPLSLTSLKICCFGGDYWEMEEVQRFATEIMKFEDLVEFSVRCTDDGKKGYYRTREYTSVEELRVS